MSFSLPGTCSISSSSPNLSRLSIEESSSGPASLVGLSMVLSELEFDRDLSIRL